MGFASLSERLARVGNTVPYPRRSQTQRVARSERHDPTAWLVMDGSEGATRPSISLHIAAKVFAIG